MKINSIEIKDISGGYLKANIEKEQHIKTLPCLSVVQSLNGYYEIALGKNKPVCTQEGGVFIAPAGVKQDIIHHNGINEFMKAQWVFMNVTINDFFTFEDVFDMPVTLSSKDSESLSELILAIRTTNSTCQKYIAAYQIVEFLIAHSKIKDTIMNNTAAQIKKYISQHYAENITIKALSDIAFCSVPNLYRIFQKYFHLSPHNYINKFRLEKASVLLENSTASISSIAEEVGFEDAAYFSKLFKNNFSVSPQKYRENALLLQIKK